MYGFCFAQIEARVLGVETNWDSRLLSGLPVRHSARALGVGVGSLGHGGADAVHFGLGGPDVLALGVAGGDGHVAVFLDGEPVWV
jgi:hypothetical protein